MNIMVNIFDYTNYRLFLKDFYKEKKKKNPNFSYRYIAQKVAFKSAGHFTQIINGQANISTHLITRFCKFLKLKKREIEYFELLVAFDQAKTLEEKRHFYERIVNFKEVSAKILSPEQYEFYTKWYYAVIRDILSTYEFTGDYRELAKIVIPAISTAEAEKTIKLLLKLGLICINDKGVHEVTDAFISANPEEQAVVLSGYARQMIDRAKEAVDLLPREERIVSWSGFSVSKRTFELIAEEIRATRKRIRALVSEDKSPNRVYHFNTQFFPVSREIKHSTKRKEL